NIDIFVPKGFSPNGDGHNDRLDVFLVGISRLIYFRVFNRWGQLLFETNDPAQLWDGTFNGQKQPLETYVWIAEGIGENGIKIVRRGQTILLR
ncbi:MAG: gliding motility-associated C-terminal domain-containing protein, partial [bacterium]